MRIAELTTLRLGGPAARVETAGSTADMVSLARAADAGGEPLLLIGGGSNLVVGDQGWPGLVIRVASQGLRIEGEMVTVAAGQSWDELVTITLQDGLVGLETMSGIPGLVGATPIQNVGAYGCEVADVLTTVTVYDRESGQVQQLPASDCGFGFRTSRFKNVQRWILLEVTMQLSRSGLSRPIRYLELARRLGIEPGAATDPWRVRDEVLALRRSKGMVLDPADFDTWSVGSFFVNPLLEVVPEAAAGCPSWQTDGRTKLSAAWLIEKAGFARGYGLQRGRGAVAVSSKHTLALTNRGTGTTTELLALAAEIRDGVRAQFGITLGPEAHLVGCNF